ncbi:hypothetical protein TRICI_003256 [Trichomonascus ciferrii]|uniref:Major facilitator superfamily (MFS) profile domain-containing protein n=1 Tax=Trichomonascus ciferrii TaxID=44093 RepID=A0A642V4E8_9ASCO|nr:hypothetical protein TRICI_003256 [Trichomonascus ciferrii]
MCRGTGFRAVQVGCAIVWCFLSAGIVFGFAALKPVLIAEGVYGDECSNDELRSGSPVCSEQDLKLNRMFTYSAVLTNIVSLPVGYILDRVGPRKCGMIGAVIIAAGAGLFSNARSVSEYLVDGYMVGYILLALGGPFVFISCFHLSNSFPRFSGTILALLTGAFDSSSAVFMFYRLVYERIGLSLGTFFTLYLIVPAFILLGEILIMPREPYSTVGDVTKVVEAGVPEAPQRTYVKVRQFSVSESTRPLLGSRRHSIEEDEGNDCVIDDDTHEEDNVVVNPTEHAEVWGALHQFSARDQIKSPWFILMAIFTAIQMLRINYFLATVLSQYTYLLGSKELARLVNQIFDLALPIGGVVAVPFIGILLDNFSTPTALLVLFTVSTAIGILGLFPSLVAGMFKIGLLVIYRPFYYTLVSDYTAKVFGFDTFGQVYGLVISVSGLISLAQAYLDILTHEVFNLNPIPVNAILLSLTVLSGVALLAFIKQQVHKHKYGPLPRERHYSYSAINQP